MCTHCGPRLRLPSLSALLLLSIKPWLTALANFHTHYIMTKDIDELFDAYFEQQYPGPCRTEGWTGVNNLEKLCLDLGYGTGMPCILNFLADNPRAIEMLFELIRNGVCDPYNMSWAEALNLESYQDEANDGAVSSN